VDADGSGDLDPGELVPIILEAAKSHGDGDYTVTQEQAVEFCKIFDDDGNGKPLRKSCAATKNVSSDVDLIPNPLSLSIFFHCQVCWIAKSS
jgi:hypothetical protein